MKDIFYRFRNRESEKFPEMIHLVITNVCNISCRHCAWPVVKKTEGFTPAYLDFDLYKRIVQEFKGHPDAVLRFTCDGEPLMHKQVVEMVRYGKENGISPITMNTNGILLDPERSREILDAGMDLIEISINAFDRTSYHNLRKSDSYDRVMDNIMGLLEIRKKGNYETKIMVSIVEMDDNRKDLRSFNSFWGERVDKVIVRRPTSYRGLVNGISEEEPEVERWPCYVLWKRLTITADGRARFCFNDWLNQSVIFDLKKGDISIGEIWQSEKYKSLRNLHLERRFAEIPYCAECNTWKVLRWEDEYGTVVKKYMEK